MELIQEWTLLDDAGRNLCRHVLQDNCRTPAPRGKAFATLVLPVCRCSFFLFLKLLIYLFMAVLGLSLLGARGTYSLVAVRGFLTAATSLVMEYKLWDAQASVVVAPWL